MLKHTNRQTNKETRSVREAWKGTITEKKDVFRTMLLTF